MKGKEEQAIEAVLPAVSPRLQSNDEGIITVYNLHYITYAAVTSAKIGLPAFRPPGLHIDSTHVVFLT